MRKCRFFFYFLLIFSFTFLTAEEDLLVHECGVALVRLRKPISYYRSYYNDPAWGIKKLMTLMEKQKNRGQDGTGIAVVKFNMPSGREYLNQVRVVTDNPLYALFDLISNDLQQLKHLNTQENDLKMQASLLGEAMLGHLRYGTYAGNHLKYCQPFVRYHEIPCRHFALAGNFNMTNMSELKQQLEEWGHIPPNDSDTQVILNMIAYYVDQEYARIDNESSHLKHSHLNRQNYADAISEQIDLVKVMKDASQKWDGGYVFCGIFGNGDVLICRDPSGIRPGYYLMNDEVIAVASERIALIDTFDVLEQDVLPIKPGHVIVIKKNGDVTESSFTAQLPERQCVFERIYFSQANDAQIYEERKALGRELAPRVFAAIEGKLEQTVFTFVPNSSISAFQGLIEELTRLSRTQAISQVKRALAAQESTHADLKKIEQLIMTQVKAEHLISKNQKLRTFISNDQARKKVIPQIYEITNGIVGPEDTLVVIDDSIVRGVTLKEALIQKLIRLNPKKIILVSSAPPIFYPDCYGIDISQLGQFIAFQAAISLLHDQGLEQLLDEVETACIQEDGQLQNHVQKICSQFTLDEISNKVAQLLMPSNTEWKGSIQVIYQSLEGLHRAIPKHNGDWYFSGNYPTQGGFKIANSSFLKWMQGDDSRSY